MSSYVVDDETINRIVSFLYAKATGPDCWIQDSAEKITKMGIVLGNFEHCERLADLMFALNVAAVNAKYGEGEAEKFRPLNFKYRLAFPGSQMQAIKALDTWLHQCPENDVHLHRLYSAMEQIRDLLCIDYVRRTDEYEAVRWG